MAGRRLSMRKIREVLRLKWIARASARQIAKSCNIARSTVKEYLKRAQDAGLTWPMACELDDASLEDLLYPKSPSPPINRAPMPPMDYLYREMCRKSVTLQLLWYEYKQEHPDGYQYSFFCEQYRNWVKKLDRPMRQKHLAGEKMFVDFAGQTVDIIDAKTGEVSQAHIFIAVLGASNYTYAEAVSSESLPCWINAHIHAFEYFGGVPQIAVPDNLKAGVTHPCRYEPDINPTYQDLAEHYGTSVIPARPGKARDKAKVESAVLVAERWILAALRNHTFFSLAELNRAIADKLRHLNNRKLQKLDATRKTLYETIDKPALKPLPSHRYEYAEWKKARVNIDYHVEVDRQYYSVPYQLARKQVDVRFTATSVEVLFKNRRVAAHKRSYVPGGFTTLKEHMPKSHLRYLQWTPSRIIRWAGKNGPYTEKLVRRILEQKTHPEQGFRSVLGIMRLSKHYTPERVEKASIRALSIGSISYKSLKSILKSGLDQQPLLFDRPEEAQQPSAHRNIRGRDYYHQGTGKEASHAQ
jgi:transposase